MDEGVVEGSEDVADSEDVLGLLSSSNHGGPVVSYLFLLGGLALSAFFSSLLAFTLSFGLNARDDGGESLPFICDILNNNSGPYLT